MESIDEANATLRKAVSDRIKAVAAGLPAEQWYADVPTDPPFPQEPEAEEDSYPYLGPGFAHPVSQKFYDLCEQLKEMHRRKSSDYGCPSGTDPLANIRNGAKFVGIEPWRAAMVRLSDKVTRLATFNATGSLTFEGVEDSLFDLASYALLSLLLYREQHGK